MVGLLAQPEKGLVGPDDVCFPTHRLKGTTNHENLMETEKSMQLTDDTARNQHHGYDKRGTETQTSRQERREDRLQTGLKQHGEWPGNCEFANTGDWTARHGGNPDVDQ